MRSPCLHNACLLNKQIFFDRSTRQALTHIAQLISHMANSCMDLGDLERDINGLYRVDHIKFFSIFEVFAIVHA